MTYECDICGKTVYGDFMAVDTNNVRYCKECLKSEPKCKICGDKASHMISTLGLLCDQCFTTNPLLMNASTRGMEK